MTCIHGQNISGFLTCTLWLSNFVLNVTSVASAYILVAFTLEVYLATVHPVLHRRLVTNTVACLAVTAAWAGSTIVACAVLMKVGRVLNGLCYPSYYWSSMGKAIGWSYIVVKLLAPCGVFVACYAHILASLVNRRDKVGLF